MENKKYCPICITLTVKLVGNDWVCSKCNWSREDGDWNKIGGDTDDGYGGVREPRRPKPSAPSSSAVVEKVLIHT